MTEAEARDWIRARFGVPRETAVAQFLDLLITESADQNLISVSSISEIWRRHVVDSAQLLGLAPADRGALNWADIGTGAGFPGMVLALLSDHRFSLIEPRRRRAEFLQRASGELGISHRVRVQHARAENIEDQVDVISARAVAALRELLKTGRAISTEKTLWLLPKGPNAREEVAATRRTWHGTFHVEPSITQPDSLIVVATGVKPR
jgi:16S rRNA (guanine527-N7)-methyltransferase